MQSFIPKCIHLQCPTQLCVNGRLVLQIRIFRKNKHFAIMQSAMYVSDFKDLDFIWAYLAGLSLTLAAK